MHRSCEKVFFDNDSMPPLLQNTMLETRLTVGIASTLPKIQFAKELFHCNNGEI